MYVKVVLLVMLTLKTPLNKALLAAVPGFTPATSTLPALPGTKVKGQGFVVVPEVG
jgi:hypothetical protein